MHDSRSLPWWQVVVVAVAVVAAAVAVWVTLNADFLAHPGWLAAQKADIILGPVLVGLYWMRVRPQSRFGPLLIGFGCIGAVYILQSSGEPWLFGPGVFWEGIVYLGNLVLILTFPSGRLEGLAAKSIVAAGVVIVGLDTLVVAMLPQLGPDGSISGCRRLCPDNALAIVSRPDLAADLYRLVRIGIIAVALATAALLVWRMLRGTPPQRRAIAIGAFVALVFTVLQIAYQFLKLVDPDGAALHAYVQWGLAGARSLIWYGFLCALIAAQLFAGRALGQLVRQSLRRPSPRELEAMLRVPLGDPELRLVFLDDDGVPPAAEPGRDVTIVERDGAAAVAIVHDAQLNDDPELLQAAGAAVLLVAENAELDAAWNTALDELRRSRVRLVRAGDDERQRVERNLHDGVQQRLIAMRINLGIAGESADAATRSQLNEIGESIDDAIDELRELSHGLNPPLLRERGLVAALERVIAPFPVRADEVGRHPTELESAVYFCCLEAIQNAAKHSGREASISLVLWEDADELHFEVADDGRGFDAAPLRTGAGLQHMHDRLGALDGRLAIVSSPGHGTVVSGTVPLGVPLSLPRAGAGARRSAPAPSPSATAPER